MNDPNTGTTRTPPSLIRLASAAFLGVALVGILLTGGMKIVNELAAQGAEISRAQATFLDRQRGRVRDAVLDIVRRIDSERDQAEHRIKTMVRARTEEAVAVTAHLHQTYKDTLPPSALKDLVREALRPIRFNNGRGYIYVVATNGIHEVAPTQPNLEGTLLRDGSGSPHDVIGRDMIDLAAMIREGFYRYAWPHPDKPSDQTYEKIAYLKLFPPFSWIIGTGEYRIDMDADIQQRILEDIRRIQRPGVDKAFVTRWDGVLLAGPAEGANALYLEDVNGFRFIDGAIRVAKEGGGFLQYDMGPNSPVGAGQHLTYVQGIPEWGWSVGATVSIDAVRDDLDAIRANVSATVQMTILQTSLLMLMMSFATVALVWRGRSLMLRNMDLFLTFFQDASRTARPIDLSRVSFSEFVALARSANTMLETLDRTQAHLRESQERFELAVRGSGDALWLYDTRTSATWLSPRYMEMLGYHPGDKPDTFEAIENLMHLDDRQQVLDAFYAHLQTDVPYDVTYRVLSKSGAYRWMRSRAGSVRDPEGYAISTGGSASDITERKEAEDRLRFTQEAMDNATDGILWIRVDTGHLEYVNNSICRRLGYDRQQMMGLRASDLDDGLTPDHLRDLHETLDATPSMTLDRRQKTRDGGWLDVEITLSRARRGAVNLLMVWVRDVSALAAQTRNFVALLENTRDFVLIKDTEHRYQAASQALARFIGHGSWRDLLGRTDRDLMPAERARVTIAEERVLLAGEQPSLDAVQPWIGVDGTVCWMDTMKQPIRDGNGTIVGLFGICRDITGRKQSEEQLRRNRQLLEGVLENSPALIYAKDRQGRYIFVNRQWEKRFGHLRDRVIGRTDMDLFPDDLARQYRDNDLTVMAANRPLEQEEILRDGEGAGATEAVLLARKVPLPDASGQAEGICGISTDITDRKAMERELSARVEELAEARRAALNMMFDLAEERQRADVLRERAEAANRSKSSFLAAMSHEIRTPMNGVVGMIDLLRETPLTADQRSMMNTVRESAFSLLQIINDILDHSKIEAGRLTLESIPISIRDTLEGVAETLLANAVKKDVRLSLFVDPAIPPRLSSDQVRLRQILFNLAGNAIKFTQTSAEHQGHVHLSADLVAPAEDGRSRVAFAIRDNGIGMSSETISKLFQPFTQADQSTTRRFGGTGLGLSICRTLTDMMSGAITVESAEGQGSTFTVTLPFSVVEDASAEEPDLAGVKIACLVRDEDDAAIVERYCRARGASVVRLSALADAVTAADQADVLVLSDAWGRVARETTIARVRERAPDMRFVVLTPDRSTSRSVIGPDAVAVDTNPILRSAVLRAVAVAAGRASPDMDDIAPHDSTGAHTAPTVEAARAAGHLILVAEDNVTNQDVIRRQLTLLGFACEVAGDGLEALESIKKNRHAMLLTDCHMPRMDGFTLTAAVRALEQDRARDETDRLPIIAITANVLQGEAERCLAAGMDDYLPKPLEMGKLKAMLAKWMPAGAKGPAADPRPPRPASRAGATPPASSRQPAAVDRAPLVAMFGDNETTIREVLVDFVAPAREIVTELQAAVTQGQAQAAAQAAHKLKSAARAIGANALADLCADLERAGKAGDMDRIAGLLPELDPRFAAVEAVVFGQGNAETDTPRGADQPVAAAPAPDPSLPASASPKVRSEERPTPHGDGGAPTDTTSVQTNARPNDRPAIDLAALGAVFGDDTEAIHEVLGDFLDPSRTIVAEVESAVAGRVTADVIRATHKLKSSARAVGAETLADLCQDLERAGKANDWTTLDSLHPRLEPAFAAVEAHIHRLRRGTDP